jgi:hypothetical protein
MPYKIDRDLLTESPLKDYKELAANNFIYVSPDKAELQADAERQVQFGGKFLLDNDKAAIQKLTPEQFNEEIAKLIFPAGYANSQAQIDLLQKYYTQGFLFYASSTLGEAVLAQTKGKYVMGETTFLGRDKSGSYNVNVRYDSATDQVLLELVMNKYYVFDMANNEEYPMRGSQWVYELTPQGFRFRDANIEEKIIYDMILGRDELDSLEKIPTQTAIPTLRDQFNAAFHEVYNPNRISRNDVGAFVGLNDDTDPYNAVYDKIETYPLGIILSIPKNILKLFTEFLPLLIEKASALAIARSAEVTRNSALRILLQAVPAATFATAWTFRQIARRLTSPVQSCKDAYNYGARYHKVLGVALASLSALVTVGTFVLAGYGAAIGLAAAGAPFLAKAAIWEVGETAGLGSMLTAAGIKLGALFGATLSTFSASVLAGTVITSAITAGVILIRDRFKAALGWKARRDVEIEEQKIIDANRLEHEERVADRVNSIATTHKLDEPSQVSELHEEEASNIRFNPLFQPAEQKAEVEEHKHEAAIEEEQKPDPQKRKSF